ncbi:MAG: transposase [Elusimicrobiota bacterium]
MIRNSSEKSKIRIDKIGTTTDYLTSRGGLAFVNRYIESINIYPLLKRYFGSMRKTCKGLPINELYKQLFCFFIDGTSFRLTRFDELAKDRGYASTIETPQSKMASSHQIKRFFRAFSFVRNYLFRRLLQTIFIWRLNITKPAVIILDLDTMVMANDDALKREGVEPTYKKKKGFQPLLLKWGLFVVDAVFRGGSKNSNNGDTVIKMIEHVVVLIRNKYRADVPIILKEDRCFYDQKNFKAFEELGIGHISGGKIYATICEYVENCPQEQWVNIEKKNQTWEILEFGDCRGTWDKFRRAIFTQPLYEDNQKLLPFARPARIYYTNLGMGGNIDILLKNAGLEYYLDVENIVELAHQRGADELVHRGIKDFGTEQLPFKRFESNTAFFYIMLVAF